MTFLLKTSGSTEDSQSDTLATCRCFKLSLTTIALSQSNCRNFSCSGINLVIVIIRPFRLFRFREVWLGNVRKFNALSRCLKTFATNGSNQLIIFTGERK